MAQNNKFNPIIPLIVSGAVVIGILIGYILNDKENPKFIKEASNDDSFGRVEELIRFVETRYLDTIARDEMTDSAIHHLLGRLDPHSKYYSAFAIDARKKDERGRFKGVGVELFFINDTINIVRTIENGPAHKAGIKPFDKLIAVNDTIVAGADKEFNEIRKYLLGHSGDQLNMTVLRGKEQLNLSLTIDNIKNTSVKNGHMMDDKTAYVKITDFTSDTYKDFMDYFEGFDKKGVQNLIIDLRENRGGLLEQSTNILNQLFTQEKQLLAYTQGRSGDKEEFLTNGKPFFSIDKIAILIDESSASASELLAGSIQDWDRGIVIGNRSFGKALVQEAYTLSDGGALSLSVGKYYLPSGRCVQKEYSTDREKYYKSKVVKVDSTVYYTKVLNRKMYAHGGITPDVIVGQDASLTQEENEAFKDISKLVFEKVSNNRNINEDEVLTYVSRKLKLKRNIIATKVNEYFNLYTNREKTLQNRLKNDTSIQKAFEYFNGDIKLN